MGSAHPPARPAAASATATQAAPVRAPISERLAAFVHGLRHDAIPAEVRERARHLILDASGCALAAGKFPFAPKSLAAIAGLAGSGNHPVIGQSLRLPMRDAMIANGLLAHGLDYDDTHSEGIVHLTVSAFPAVLGLASELNLPGRDLLTAYIAALETGARIASVARGGFHQVGFHPTSLAGTFACALAAGKLYGLSIEQLVAAQGVALSVTGGSLEFLEDGAWTKRFHPGWAAAGGVTAAAMARHDFVAPRAAYEGRFGLYASHLGPLAQGLDYERAAAALGSTWETLQVAIKPFPACHFAHGIADAAIALHARLKREGIAASRIASVMALVPAETVKAICEPVAAKRRPVSDYDAKFSTPFITAAGLLRGRFGLAELEDEALHDPEILALAARVDYAPDPASTFPAHYTGELILRLDDGRELRHREAMNRGCADRPLSNADIQDKFMQNALLVLPEARARRILEAVLGLETTANARALAEVLALPAA